MKREEIDHILDLMAAEAAEKGDESLLPGVISMDADSYALNLAKSAACTNILHGIRYRGVEVLVSRSREDKVLNRSEADGEGAPYFDLEPPAASS